MDSILTSVKKMLGIDEEYTHFDSDVTLHINSVMLSLNQLGVGPDAGFMITDKTETWSNLLLDRLDLIASKTFIFLKVKLLFDPPSSGFVVDAMERQIKELEWRLNVQAEKQVTT
jgi:hypothetical protein